MKTSRARGVGVEVRLAAVTDVPGILAVQEPGAIAGLGHVFPQDQHPFPVTVIGDRWRREIEDPHVVVFVASEPESGQVVGFAARSGDELMHFGTAVSTWGTGVASLLHDAVLATFPADVRALRLRVFEANARARRFYEKHGWRSTGRTSLTAFPPHPSLVEYTRPR